jgi:uncharacterized protein (TIGR02611 family)
MKDTPIFSESIPARPRSNGWRIVSLANHAMNKFARLRRVIIAVIGFTVLLIGVALVVLPGPAIVVIPLGLAILATEFVWARRLLQRARATFGKKASQPEAESPDRWG